MLFQKTYNMWLDRVARIPPKYKAVGGRQVSCSKHRTYPARMLRKLKILGFAEIINNQRKGIYEHGGINGKV